MFMPKRARDIVPDGAMALLNKHLCTTLVQLEFEHDEILRPFDVTKKNRTEFGAE